ncbi:GMC family oxidoreductase [Halioxenophilus sp. WMMB6]|uniref:GMC family oxidoreductase n=1 Tax=Halioxenophilus sp. WMMB6 TaxID=3073815 RepID=UPI00295E6690|nr:GMC family oxidoreductase [Halioxenophilus sp. WMMB6]
MINTTNAQVLSTPAEANTSAWDAIIIGAGMGGGSIAHALCQAGQNVLLIEKGNIEFATEGLGVQIEQEDPDERLMHGKWPTKLRIQVNGRAADLWAPLGCGVGGSTLLYAAALQRLEPMDFASREGPSGQPLEWPFSYDQLQPYYQKAESLFSVKGGVDPRDTESQYALPEPPTMSGYDAVFFKECEKAGLNPYRIHVAIDYTSPDCGECGGNICTIQCKRNTYNSAIAPALASGQLTILAECEVDKLEADQNAVTGVVVSKNGETVTLAVGSANLVLSAGSYFSPVLLLKSSNEHWPDGLANSSGMVGRNLMFHASEFIAFWLPSKASRNGPKKTVAVRDFYEHDGVKLGEVQSTGRVADYGLVLYALRLMFDASAYRFLKPVRQLLRIPAYLAAKLYGKATIYATIVEDFPYPENRINYDSDAPSGIRVEYHVRKEFEERVVMLRQLIRKSLKGIKSMPMNQGVNLNYGHPCGTIKAGNDKSTSVLDANCKAHDLDNLYVVDGSFMPTSGGTNPSLTIAANALRVADQIIARRASTPEEQLAS